MMEILILILIYILGCIVATCLGAIADVYLGCNPKYPIWYSFLSWMMVIFAGIGILCTLISSGFESLYEWTYNHFKKEE